MGSISALSTMSVKAFTLLGCFPFVAFIKEIIVNIIWRSHKILQNY